MGCTTWNVKQALAELDRVAPGAPLLALGQTVLWDEPMKAGVALAAREAGIRFVAGVHDTDYFAKLPSGPREPGRFRAFPHNDTTTRGLWSAAGEFSALFGSETVVTRHELAAAGLKLAKILRGMPGALDEATEAYGWRGIVSLDESPPVVADLPVRGLIDELHRTFKWALDETVGAIGATDRSGAQSRADQLLGMLCDAAEEPGLSLGGLYRRMLPELHRLVSGEPVEFETATTTQLLQFNEQTCALPRFELLGLFLNPDSSDAARHAYDEAVAGSEIYTLDRFGTGAIPFDLYIPGKGRGTVRIGSRGAVIETRKPEFLSYKHPPASVRELSALIEAKFGPDCVMIGKAVTLIGLLAREFVFVFHEGASPYVRHTARFAQNLRKSGIALDLNPILRVRYAAWDALEGCCTWLRLPEPLEGAFGAGEICAPSFAKRWREVGTVQEALIERLSSLRRPMDLIRFLDERLGGSWNQLASEYSELHDRMQEVHESVGRRKQERSTLYARCRAVKQARADAERAMGRHFRSAIFEKAPSESDLAERSRLAAEVDARAHELAELKAQIRLSIGEQSITVTDPSILRVHERRRAIELEAELKRMRLVRNAIVASRGLVHAGRRPSAWWFPLVCPAGSWFKRTVDSAQCYLEPLSPVGSTDAEVVLDGRGGIKPASIRR